MSNIVFHQMDHSPDKEIHPPFPLHCMCCGTQVPVFNPVGICGQRPVWYCNKCEMELRNACPFPQPNFHDIGPSEPDVNGTDARRAPDPIPPVYDVEPFKCAKCGCDIERKSVAESRRKAIERFGDPLWCKKCAVAESRAHTHYIFPAQISDPMVVENQVEVDVFHECMDLAKMLIDKNRSYGNSALDPLRVFSKADRTEQLKVRIDDKLSRMMRGQSAGEDVMLDLLGYLILLRVAEKTEKKQ